VSLAVFSNLPRLRDRLRAVDQATGQYLATGQAQWLARRDEALGQIRGIEREIGDVLTDSRARALLDSADRSLMNSLAEQSPYITRRRAGRLPPEEAARAARLGAGLELAAEPLRGLADAQIAGLKKRREDMDAATTRTAWLIVLAGAGAAFFVAWYLSRSLTGPVAALRDYSRGWALGRDWRFSPLRASPEVSDLAEAMSDMAQRLNAQFAREAELSRLKGNLVSMASHEFNNALSVLSGAAALLQSTESAAAPRQRAEYFAVIEANLRSLTQATSSLLDLGRLEDGGFAVRPRRIEPRRALIESVKALRPLIDKKNLAVHIAQTEKPLYAMADPEALQLVAINLLGNAVKYTPEDGRINAGIREEADRSVVVYVEDSGIGVKAEDRDRIQAGYRTDEGRRLAPGLGVGLTLVRRILEAHGTRLVIDGAPVQGTVFSFRLPTAVLDDESAV
jgi:signal transduction histidine kinase